jgi:hypothetical protein
MSIDTEKAEESICTYIMAYIKAWFIKLFGL